MLTFAPYVVVPRSLTSGVAIILDNSELAKRLKASYKGTFAIKVAGTYVFK